MDAVFDLAGEADTLALSAAFAAVARAGDLLALSGPLGAGKTVFARGFIHALADRAGHPREEVPSPTFTLVQFYDGGALGVAHFDLYRIGDPAELVELGLEEALAGGAVLVEWPDRLAAAPGIVADAARLDIALAAGAGAGGGRRAVVAADENWRDRLGVVTASLPHLVSPPV